MADPPPLRLALPPDLAFERSPALADDPFTAQPEPLDAHRDAGADRPDDDITTTLRVHELFGIELDDPVALRDVPQHSPGSSGGVVPGSPTGHGDTSDIDDIEDDADDGATGRRVRPYTITGGRTAVDGPEIPLEAQVLTSNQGPIDPSRYRWETARLVQMLEVPMALIEVAARLEVPVGVARVLVSDLVAEGVLIIHLPPPCSSFTSLLEQVLDGVRKL